MEFSSILDISSFFIGMIINLIFVALMCYYFKRKYDYLELAQNEQAKILYQLIHKPAACTAPCNSPCMDFSCDPLAQMKPTETDSDSDSGSESESENDEENPNITLTDITSLNIEEVKTVDLNVTVEEIQTNDPLEITLNMDESENAYSKMSMKQLKELLSSKGIKAKNNIRKDELIDLITKELP
jgi:hypothetical protein